MKKNKKIEMIAEATLLREHSQTPDISHIIKPSIEVHTCTCFTYAYTVQHHLVKITLVTVLTIQSRIQSIKTIK